jgi:hypothetical protein
MRGRGRLQKLEGLVANSIAAGFCAKAQTLQESHPLVAAMFEQLAAQYEHNARREDEDARLDKEGP